MSITCLDDVKNAYYINLTHRTDRKEYVEQQLESVGIKAQRFNAIKMDNGAVGCSMSHLKLLQQASENALEHIFIVEDDITFLEPEVFKTQINAFFSIHGNDWDVILLAGNNLPPYIQPDHTCVQVTTCQTTTGYLVNGHYIKTLINNVKTGLTNLLHNPHDHFKYAIDKYWFELQKKDRWFLITPLTVVQKEGYSDIEKRHTNYVSIMKDLNKEHFFKKRK